MSENVLSVFIDESGDFGAFERHSPYYIVSMVLHNQNVDISEQISELEYRLSNLGYPQHTVHTGPLIRRESVYSNDLMKDRKHLFNILCKNHLFPTKTESDSVLVAMRGT